MKVVIMEKRRFYKEYPTGHRLKILFLNEGYPIVEGEKPDGQLSTEMEKDEDYFKYRVLDDTTLLNLKQKSFSEVRGHCC